jgi:hypothetical protein
MPQPPSSTTSPAIHEIKRKPLATASRLLPATTPAQCYCLAVGLFLLIRAGSTLIGGATYALPGDGWRAILQLALATLLIAATTVRTTARNAVIFVGLIYAAQTLLVHPTIAILALVAAAATRRGGIDLRPQPPRPN